MEIMSKGEGNRDLYYRDFRSQESGYSLYLWQSFLLSNYHYVSEILSLPILKTEGNIPITLMPSAKLRTPEEN